MQAQLKRQAAQQALLPAPPLEPVQRAPPREARPALLRRPQGLLALPQGARRALLPAPVHPGPPLLARPALLRRPQGLLALPQEARRAPPPAPVHPGPPLLALLRKPQGLLAPPRAAARRALLLVPLVALQVQQRRRLTTRTPLAELAPFNRPSVKHRKQTLAVCSAGA